MLKFAANLTMMYGEYEFVDRFAAAARDGFKAVEFFFPYAFPAHELRARLTDNGLEQAIFNSPPGDWEAGERGVAALQGRQDEFRNGFSRALEYSNALGNRKIHVLAGIVEDEGARDAQLDIYRSNLEFAAREAQTADITVLIEPINHRRMPGYLLSRQEEAQQICSEIGAPNLQVLFDIYHCQIAEGDVTVKLQRDFNRPNGGIGHIQIAGVPDRHEPNIGELNYSFILDQIDRLGYSGWIGCEYIPAGSTSGGLNWLRDRSYN